MNTRLFRTLIVVLFVFTVSIAHAKSDNVAESRFPNSGFISPGNSNSLASIASDFFQARPSPAWGEDPGEPDTVYLSFSDQAPDRQVVQIRLVTDNANRPDSIVGFYLPVIITTDRPGVVLDTTIAATFDSSAVVHWKVKHIGIQNGSADPSVFPMEVIVGAINTLVPGYEPLRPGDNLLARLIFSVSQPTDICIDTITSATNLPLLLTTWTAYDYRPQWRGGCFEEVIPEDVDGDTQSAFSSLDQNFPNPFNAGTMIRFSLPDPGHVTLEVFNLLGQRVKSLVNGQLSAGNRSILWDGTDNDGIKVASGIYFYRLRTDTFTQTRKMFLVR
jgi:hypothetical protein